MLELALLGTPRINLQGEPLTIRSRKAQGLLVYLVTEQRRTPAKSWHAGSGKIWNRNVHATI